MTEEEVKYVTMDDYKLAYEVYGEGENVVLCFHGNSRTAKDFKFLQKKDRKIISVHLFLHEYSTFSAERTDEGNVYIEDVQKLVEMILVQEEVDEFSWVAYSQGGLFTFALFPLLAERVKNLYLIAPDGLNDKSFYSWSQRQWWARKLFKRWVRKPDELLAIIRFLVRIKILHPKMIEFMDYYTSDPRILNMAHDTWRGFRNIRPQAEDVKIALDNNPRIRFNLIVGQFDQIITVKSAKKFLKRINRPEALIEIPHGHNVWKPEIEHELYYHLKFR